MESCSVHALKHIANGFRINCFSRLQVPFPLYFLLVHMHIENYVCYPMSTFFMSMSYDCVLLTMCFCGYLVPQCRPCYFGMHTELIDTSGSCGF